MTGTGSISINQLGLQLALECVRTSKARSVRAMRKVGHAEACSISCPLDRGIFGAGSCAAVIA